MRIYTPPMITTQKKHLEERTSLKVGRSPVSMAKQVAVAKKDASPISRSELASLAEDFKNGVIDRDEANKRLIRTVINNSIAGKLGEKDREQIIHCIQEFFSADPNFQAELAKNLNDFA